MPGTKGIIVHYFSLIAQAACVIHCHTNLLNSGESGFLKHNLIHASV